MAKPFLFWLNICILGPSAGCPGYLVLHGFFFFFFFFFFLAPACLALAGLLECSPAEPMVVRLAHIAV